MFANFRSQDSEKSPYQDGRSEREYLRDIDDLDI
jgi:hypothetical protein